MDMQFGWFQPQAFVVGGTLCHNFTVHCTAVQSLIQEILQEQDLEIKAQTLNFKIHNLNHNQRLNCPTFFVQNNIAIFAILTFHFKKTSDWRKKLWNSVTDKKLTFTSFRWKSGSFSTIPVTEWQAILDTTVFHYTLCMEGIFPELRFYGPQSKIGKYSCHSTRAVA